ncbi:amidase [Pragia fontium DSM 5563 = ATCC 49100]|uniref:Amidase n=1 Tax=Pragia fontium DSM 5563 = ATCC 49100 TaxID=1122977 RepID=A0AAJ4W7D2_9GAMM|nr:acetamidase/formamidase family protein [Pragia fontium]SFB96223.1 amidase [Pragia fontium DSM 5563 = ATCC 49100]VEJ54315.1 Formamidase [Pragia fontium]
MITITREKLIYAMSASNPPVCRVPPKTDICFQTCDCFEDQIESKDTPFNGLDWNRINPATGPVYIEGAQPGDILKVTIKAITVTAKQAVMVTMPQLGVLGDELTQAEVKIVPLQDGFAHLPGGIQSPLKPMIGVIGVAPEGEAISCGTPDKHGGNMDSKIIRQGATLWLPVNVEGALLALGDLHAGMGDGEVSGCGLEVAGEVVLSVEVIKGKRYPLPMVIDEQYVYTIASELTVDEAVTSATKNMTNLLVEQGNLTRSDAISLMSIVGDLQICQVVDPLKTCRFAMPQQVIQQLGIKL